jgi:hypothetical protein
MPENPPGLSPHRDAKLARIHPAETNGEYAAYPDGASPRIDETRGAAGWPSDALHMSGQCDERPAGPPAFARSGGTRRK